MLIVRVLPAHAVVDETAAKVADAAGHAISYTETELLISLPKTTNAFPFGLSCCLT